MCEIVDWRLPIVDCEKSAGDKPPLPAMYPSRPGEGWGEGELPRIDFSSHTHNDYSLTQSLPLAAAPLGEGFVPRIRNRYFVSPSTASRSPSRALTRRRIAS